jgi:hypothetical protein
MSKKSKATGMETPDYEQASSATEVEERIAQTKDTVCRKVKMQLSIKEAKKEADAAYNEQLKELAEEIDHEIGVLDGWKSRLAQVEAGIPQASVAAQPQASTINMPATPFRPPVAVGQGQ